ncbi:MAG: aminodeoxychorismate synthase component I [Gammaproteobacteria bacterium]|nr:aminodeoxychorismate synthase component I [Gammaproteobacteria bacterium]
MGAISILPLPYRIDGCDYFAQLRPLAGAVFLDSARVHGAGGRFDLMSALPVCELRTHGAITRITRRCMSVPSTADPFELVAQALATDLPRAAPSESDWPFAGGAIGWFGYDLGRCVARLAPRNPPSQVPDMQIGIYGWALLQDHERRESVALFTDAVDATIRRRLIDRLLGPREPEAAAFRLESPFVSNFDPVSYAAAFARVQRYIRDGDCYQVNLAQRLSALARGDPWSAYLQLRARMASPYSAFLSGDSASVLSFSPERFLHLAGGRVETRPIKGTRRRCATPEADREQVRQLLASEKDRAENVMIVDLMRNDLGKSCRTGSVRVEKLCALESYANVHHLVSVVSGEPDPARGPTRLLADCFPGGSITGAPKIRAMQIIDELEPDPRSVYCGSIGYISAHGTMDTSIAIRTLVCDGTQVHAWGGGGIVADSDTQTEYRESLTKIEPMLEGLRAMSAAPALRSP